MFEAWKAGRTGFPIVDAGMRQLAETGCMHNRVRMIVASFLVKDLHLPWQWGARWFLEQLVDGDMANNQHGWQWAAGCGTDAAPYFRVFNPTTQGKKFDPDGAYVRRWVPEVDDDDYPEPIVDHATERKEALRRYSADQLALLLTQSPASTGKRDAGDVSARLAAQVEHRLADIAGFDELEPASGSERARRTRVVRRSNCSTCSLINHRLLRPRSGAQC